MNRLNIFVCENYFLEHQKVISIDGFDDVLITPFPCMCEDKRKVAETTKLLNNCEANGDNIHVICSNYCEILKLIKDSKSIKAHKSRQCSSHLANEGFINYIIGKGGYVIALGWLNEWKKHLKNQGFDRQTAIRFYKDFCTELVFFDAGIDNEAEKNLIELSNYLELPYIIIPTDLDMVRCLLNSIIYEWRLHKRRKEFNATLSEAQAQSAEYSAILDLVGKLSVYTDKRNIIEKIKEIFTMILGAQYFKYNSPNLNEHYSEDDYQNSECSEGTLYKLDKDKNEFCIKISHNNQNFGSMHVGGFLFPQYIEKYLNFAK